MNEYDELVTRSIERQFQQNGGQISKKQQEEMERKRKINNKNKNMAKTTKTVEYKKKYKLNIPKVVMTTIMALAVTIGIKAAINDVVRTFEINDYLNDNYGHMISNEETVRTNNKEDFYYELDEVAQNIINSDNFDLAFANAIFEIRGSSGLNDADKLKNQNELIAEIRNLDPTFMYVDIQDYLDTNGFTNFTEFYENLQNKAEVEMGRRAL